MMQKNDRIFIAGRYGMVGSAIERMLRGQGYTNISGYSHSQHDLSNQAETDAFFKFYKPEYVFFAAAKVGGIYANDNYSADFIYSNLEIQNNTIQASYKYGVKKLLFLGSSCIYPRLAKQPIKEEYLLTGELEPTNSAYAVAKIAGITMCQSYNKQYKTNFICAMPTNLFGKNDNYDRMTSHVLPAIIHKVYDAIESKGALVLWGSGKPLREFMYVDDMADACIFLMNNYNGNGIVNVGSGEEVSIAELAKMISDVAGYKGEIVFDNSMPDGTPKKLLDCSKLHGLGWKSKITLLEGIRLTWDDFLKQNIQI